MKIVVLNGSPKGDISVTMQYVHFIQKSFPQHELKILNIAQQVKKIENNNGAFQNIMDEIAAADGVLWAFPLYVLLVHSHYKRFIELLFERSAQAAFKDKPAAILTTSIHFYDHTAINYVQGICDDLTMNYYGCYSAEMSDLLKANEREKLLCFAQAYYDAIARNAPASKVYPPVTAQPSQYMPKTPPAPIDTQNRKIVIVTDAQPNDHNLLQMTDRLAKHFSNQAEVINLHEIDIKGGCLGCIRCGYDNTCAYSGKDGFIDFYNDKLKTADIIFFAGKIHDRYLSSLWKTVFDRAFFNTHIPALAGKQISFLISGPLQQLPNLRQILEAYLEIMQANIAGIVTDEDPDSEKIDACLQELASCSIDYANAHYIKPSTFLGVGGRKIFRDEIWGHLRFPFAADHKYYKKNGLYNFPQQDYSTRMLNFILGWLIKIPAIRKKLYDKSIINKMIEPYQKVFSKL